MEIINTIYKEICRDTYTESAITSFKERVI